MDQFEWKPGFSLVKYGNVYTMNCNEEFAQRFSNVLRDCADESIAYLAKNLKSCIDSDEELMESDDQEFMLSKYSHVYILTCNKEFMKVLNTVLQCFLVTNRVSSAVFSFSQQLDNYILNRHMPKTAVSY